MSEWDTFSNSSRSVVFQAQEVAALGGHCNVTPDHLFIALLEQPEIVDLLERLDLRRKDLSKMIKARQPRGNGALGPMELTSRSKQSLKWAMRFRNELGLAEIQPAHLLAGISQNAEECDDDCYQQVGLDAAIVRLALGLSTPSAIMEKSSDSIHNEQAPSLGVTNEELGEDLVWPPPPSQPYLPVQSHTTIESGGATAALAAVLAIGSAAIHILHGPFASLAPYLLLSAACLAALWFGWKARESDWSAAALMAILVAAIHECVLVSIALTSR